MSPERIRLDGPIDGVRLLELSGDDPLEAVVQRAWERGRARGVREGAEQARDEALATLERAVERVEAAREQALASLSRTAVELAVEIARSLLRHEVREDRYDLERIVRQTLEEAGVGRGPCVVHLNPLDVERLKDVRFRTGTTIQADEGVARSDVHVETSLGLMVRETMGALEEIEKRLQEELH